MANGEVDYTPYLNKPPTKLQARFPDWLIDKVGVVFATKKEETAFREGVRLATALRMDFQASDENREATRLERAERAAQSTVPAPEAAPKPVKAAKAAKAAAAPTSPAPAPAKVTRGRRGARPAAAPATADAPF